MTRKEYAMSEISKQVNKFFNEATKKEVEDLKDNILISEHLKTVLEMKYIEGYDINYIAYKTGYSKGKIESDLRKLRKKIAKLI
jgi:DNA-directed RNA polymerase specialized sigma24 family protein